MICVKCFKDQPDECFEILKSGQKRTTCKDCRLALQQQWYAKRVGACYRSQKERRIDFPYDSKEYRQELQRRKAAREGRAYHTIEEIRQVSKQKQHEKEARTRHCTVCGRKIAQGSFCTTHQNARIAMRERQKYRENQSHRVSVCMRKAMAKSLRCGKGHSSWLDRAGYSLNELKGHLEQQFLAGMTWDNYGRAWEVDHIVPLSAFNYSRPSDIDFKRAWALKNLQPLWKSENRRKQNSLEWTFQPALAMNERAGPLQDSVATQ